MRRVLLICYYFPPMSGAGVTRPLALFKHLPEFGYECHVLTVKAVAYRVFEPSLLEGLSVDRIYRSGSFDPQRLMYLMGIRQVKDRVIRKSRAVAGWYFPDPKIGWVRRAVKLGRTLLTNRDYDAIVSTSPPMSAHLAARKLSREFGRPWIADFRDYWTIEPPERAYAGQPARIGRARRLLEAIKADATELTAVNRTVGDFVGADNVIYNCFDEDLAAGWAQPAEKRFVIGVLGALNETTPVGPLLKTLDHLRRQRRELYSQIIVRQVGEVDREWIEEQLEQFQMKGIFEIYGWQSRKDTVRLLSDATLLYIGVASDEERGLSTGRIYTMLGSGRPILAYAPPDSELSRLLADTVAGFRFFDTEHDRAATYISGLVQSHVEGNSLVTLQPTYAKPYSSRRMAEQFVKILDRHAASAYR